MKKAQNKKETFDNFREFVQRLDELMKEFYKNQNPVGYGIVITGERDLKRLTKAGFPMWEETKENLLLVGNHGLMAGLMMPLTSLQGFIPLTP